MVTPLRFSRRDRKEIAEIAECLINPLYLRLSRESPENPFISNYWMLTLRPLRAFPSARSA